MTDHQTSSQCEVLQLVSQFGWIEGDHVEFKAARGGLPRSLWETYSAMANSHGGVIILGVEDDGHVCGIQNPSQMKRTLWDTLNNRGKVSVNLLHRDDLTIHRIGELEVLVMRVPRADRHQRPVFLDQNPLTGTYRRSHEGDYRCHEQEVGRMLADRGEAPAETRILQGFSWSDFDHNTVQQYRQRMASFKPTHPWLSDTDLGLLQRLSAWRQDRLSGIEGPTLGGVLMFGRSEALAEAVPGYHVDFRERLSEDPTIRWSDRIAPDGTWEANLFQFFIRVVQKLTSELRLPFRLTPDLFRKGETEVHEAIREALVNAIVHADFGVQGGIVIERYQDQLTFSNPGTLLVSYEQLFHGNLSICRNPALHNMFMMIGASEKAGSGIDRIRRGWATQHWRLPIVRETTQPERICWTLPMISLIPDDSLTRLQNHFGDCFKTFNQLEVHALVTADIEGSVDNMRLRQLTDKHQAEITALLQNLVARGALVQESRGRWTRYQLPNTLTQLGSVHSDPSSVHSDPSSVHSDPSSVHSKPSSVHTPDLERTTKPARDNPRLPHKELERLIIQACTGRWLSRLELGNLLDRNPDGLRSRFLTPMVNHRILRLRYPTTPNRADQAYSANEDLDMQGNSPDATKE